MRRGRSAQRGFLGGTMMRRMIGRYKGCRCAHRGVGVKGCVRVWPEHEAGHDTRPRVAYHRSASNRWRWGWLTPIKGA